MAVINDRNVESPRTRAAFESAVVNVKTLETISDQLRQLARERDKYARDDHYYRVGWGLIVSAIKAGAFSSPLCATLRENLIALPNAGCLIFELQAMKAIGTNYSSKVIKDLAIEKIWHAVAGTLSIGLESGRKNRGPGARLAPSKLRIILSDIQTLKNHHESMGDIDEQIADAHDISPRTAKGIRLNAGKQKQPTGKSAKKIG